MGKNTGNLRDFRIDAPANAEGPPSTAQSRQSSVVESIVSSRESMDLWSSWDEEFKGTPDSQNPDLKNNPPVPDPKSLSTEVPKRQPWASAIALNERRMERMGVVDFTNQYHKQELLKVRTTEYMALLQDTFREHIEVFNEARHSPAHAIRIFRVSNTEEDFMLFRNGVKLVVSGARAGRIIFAFNQFMGQVFSPNQSPTSEIEAAWGPFDQLFWSYKGERIQVLDLVRYFLSEFARQSLR